MASWSKTPSSSGASSIKSTEQDAAPAPAPAPVDSVQFATGSGSRVVRRVFHSLTKAEERLLSSSGAASGGTHKRVKFPPEASQPHEYCQSAPSSTNSKPPASTNQCSPPLASSLSSSTTIATSTTTTTTTIGAQTRVLPQSTHHVKANSECERECDDQVHFSTASQSLLVLPPSSPSAPAAPSPAARKLFDNLLVRPKVHTHTRTREQLQHTSTEAALGANSVASGRGSAPAIDPLPLPQLHQHQHNDGSRIAHIIDQLHALSASSSSLPIRPPLNSPPSDPRLYAFCCSL